MATDELPQLGLVVLAAGRGRRFGRSKGLARGATDLWLRELLVAYGAAGVDAAVVVLGDDVAAYDAAWPELAAARAACLRTCGLALRVVVNREGALGPFRSLQLGLAASSSGAPVLVAPVDTLAPSIVVVAALRAGLAAPAIEAAVPRCAGKGGHPVLLAPTFAARLGAVAASAADGRLDAQLQAARARGVVADVAVDDARVLANLNTREDFAGALGGPTAAWNR